MADIDIPEPGPDFRYTHQTLQIIGSAVDTALVASFKERKAFVLLVFDFDKPGLGNYISNADRQGIISSLREMADRLEKKEVLTYNHNPN